ncbi:MAG: hypothetical protein RL386_705 [Bacteroidota bacterium]|jgi:TonB-dependent SusC/RagA subfamily outer membrane receptor
MNIQRAFCFSLAVVLSLFSACAIQQAPSAGTPPASPNVVEVGSNNTLQLVDYLRRVPGLQIEQRGSNVTVMIRGTNSISGDNSPLFVIDRQPVGTDYSDAAGAVDINDIKTVNVIKGAEGQQLYGMRGANGVIQIITRKK